MALGQYYGRYRYGHSRAGSFLRPEVRLTHRLLIQHPITEGETQVYETALKPFEIGKQLPAVR